MQRASHRTLLYATTPTAFRLLFQVKPPNAGHERAHWLTDDVAGVRT
jgi:hypothetical protein